MYAMPDTPRNMSRTVPDGNHGPAMVWVDNGTQAFLAEGSTLVVMTKEGQELVDAGYTLAMVMAMTDADKVRFIHKMIPMKDFLKYISEA